MRMKTRTAERLCGIGSLFFVFLIALMAGCGGGKGETPGTGVSVSRAGRAEFTVLWPERSMTRLIPLAANSIRLEMMRGNEVVASQLIARPDAGGSATLTFTNLPVETLTARAAAYPQADGSGVAQSAGNVSVPIVAGQTVQFTLTLTSTIDHMSVTPNASTLSVGQKVTLTATAWDAPGTGGNVVLTAPEKQQWTSSSMAVASVDSAGVVQAVSPGIVSIIVTDTGNPRPLL
jgi:hypothetical protein